VSADVLDATAGMPRVTVGADNIVIREGLPLEALYVLESGTVLVTRDGVEVSTIGQPGALFGEVSMLLRSPATATVRTATPCTFRVVSDPHKFLADHPRVTLGVATLLARRLDALTRYLVDLREQYADRDDHLGMVDTVLQSLTHSGQGLPVETGSDREHEAPY
jgi:CRP/FNR family cyclic AMP-dependent transcriptional regulator